MLPSEKLRNWILKWQFSCPASGAGLTCHKHLIWCCWWCFYTTHSWFRVRSNKWFLLFLPFRFRLHFRASQLTSRNNENGAIEKKKATKIFHAFSLICCFLIEFGLICVVCVGKCEKKSGWFCSLFCFDDRFPTLRAPIKHHLNRSRKRRVKMKTKIFFYLFSYVWQQITDRNFNLFQVSGSLMFLSFSSLFNQTIYVNCKNI